MGPGAHAAIKTLTKEGFRIISIIDTTRVARGGPKRKEESVEEEFKSALFH